MQRLCQFYSCVTVGCLAFMLGACSLTIQPQPTAAADRPKTTFHTTLPSPSPLLARSTLVSSSPSPSPRAHVIGAMATPFLTFTPPPGSTLIPTIDISQAISATSKIYSLPLDGVYPGNFVLDQQYVYWAAAEKGHLYRFPITGGENEMLVSSHFTEYSDGSLSSYWILRVGDWLIFTDTRQNDIGTWAVHALNLNTKQDKILMQEIGSHTPMWSPPPDYSAEGEWLAWTRLELGSPTRCDQSILGMTNLATGEVRELERVCTADHYIWSIPHLSGDHLIVEQDLPDKQGRQNNIFLWNRKTGEHKPLTTNGYSSMPAVSGKWVVWKEAPRYTSSRNYLIHNLETSERARFTIPTGCADSDPQVNGHWLVLYCKKTFVAYDLEQQRMVNVVQLPKGAAFRGFGLSDEWAVWGVARDTAAGKEYEIQWRRLP